jgi:hypothetical protein
LARARSVTGSVATTIVELIIVDLPVCPSICRRRVPRGNYRSGIAAASTRLAADTRQVSPVGERYGVRPPIPLRQIISSRRASERLTEALGPERLETFIERGGRMSLDEAVALTVRMADGLARESADEGTHR